MNLANENQSISPSMISCHSCLFVCECCVVRKEARFLLLLLAIVRQKMLLLKLLLSHFDSIQNSVYFSFQEAKHYLCSLLFLLSVAWHERSTALCPQTIHSLAYKWLEMDNKQFKWKFPVCKRENWLRALMNGMEKKVAQFENVSNRAMQDLKILIILISEPINSANVPREL